jgi:hypothetical protein
MPAQGCHVGQVHSVRAHKQASCLVLSIWVPQPAGGPTLPKHVSHRSRSLLVISITIVVAGQFRHYCTL